MFTVTARPIKFAYSLLPEMYANGVIPAILVPYQKQIHSLSSLVFYPDSIQLLYPDDIQRFPSLHHLNQQQAIICRRNFCILCREVCNNSCISLYKLLWNNLRTGEHLYWYSRTEEPHQCLMRTEQKSVYNNWCPTDLLCLCVSCATSLYP